VRSYEVGAKLGKGGFAKVYLAKEVASSEYYAIKVVSKASLEKESFKEKVEFGIQLEKEFDYNSRAKKEAALPKMG